MKYELDRLGPDGFEKMVQSLIQGVFSIPTIIFGDGPDGQREAVIENADKLVQEGVLAKGRTIIQAKFKSPNGKQKDWTWLQINLKKELEGFKKKTITHPDLVPKTYLFFTNIVVTPVLDKGIRDQALELIAKYKDVIPAVYLFGFDDICAMLDNNINVAKSYAAFITPGIVLSDLSEYVNKLQIKPLRSLIRYAHQEYRENHAVRWEQAGCSLDKKVDIRKVYTDLEAKDIQQNDDIDLLASQIVEWGNHVHRKNQIREDDTKQAIPTNIMLIGNAGQGKSTLCQYICQLYRMALMRRFPDAGERTETNTIEEGSDVPIPRCERIPVLVALKNYAAWINKQPDEVNHSLLSYICMLINGKAGVPLDVLDLTDLFSAYSWMFLLDGLDEVSASSNKEEVIKQIQLFINDDLNNCDGMVICTSRPQGYNDVSFTRDFKHFELKDMSTIRCQRYVDKLLKHIEENSDKREENRTILYNALEDPLTSKLMTTPLYTSIIVFMVQQGNTPPKKRYELFREYCGIIINREKSKSTLPMINESFSWIMQLHARIGFLLQAESDTKENAAAELSTSRCRAIIVDFLKEEENSDCSEEYANQIYLALIQRLTFLSEVPTDEGHNVLFPLRSMQEYFAAQWLITFSDSKNEQWKKAMEMISINSYWNNVFLFVAGYFANSENRSSANNILYDICLRNNGDTAYWPDNGEIDGCSPDVFRLVSPGSFVALRILNDNTYSKRKDRIKYLQMISCLFAKGTSWLSSIGQTIQIPDSLNDIVLQDYVVPVLEDTHNSETVAFSYLWDKALQGNSYAIDCLEKIITDISMPSSWNTQKELFGLEEKKYSVLSDSVMRVLGKWFESIPTYIGIEQYGFIQQYIHRFPQECDNLTIIRHIIMQHFDRDGKKADMFEYMNNYQTIKKAIGIVNYLQRYRYSSQDSKSYIRFNSLAESTKIQINDETIKIFEYLNLLEFSALIKYLHKPSRENLVRLVDEYKNLSGSYRTDFRHFMMNFDWLLGKIAERLSRQTVDDFLKCCDDEYWESCIEKEIIMTRLIKNQNYIEITKERMWDVIFLSMDYDCRNTHFEDVLRMIIETGEIDLVDEDLLDKLIMYKWFIKETNGDNTQSLDQLIKQFSICSFSKLWEYGEGVFFVMLLLEQMKPGEIIDSSIEFPSVTPLNHHLYSLRVIDIEKCFQTLLHLIKLDGKYLKAYMCLPFVLRDYRIGQQKVPFLEVINEDMVVQRILFLQETGNKLALLGYVMHILCFAIPESLYVHVKSIICNCISEQEMFICLLYESAYCFSIEGNFLIYDAIMTVMDGKEIDYLKKYVDSFKINILKKIQSIPVDAEELKRLAEEGHDLS